MFKRGKKDRGRERWEDGESESDSECISFLSEVQRAEAHDCGIPHTYYYLLPTKLIYRLVLMKYDSIERHYKKQTVY